MSQKPNATLSSKHLRPCGIGETPWGGSAPRGDSASMISVVTQPNKSSDQGSRVLLSSSDTTWLSGASASSRSETEAIFILARRSDRTLREKAA